MKILGFKIFEKKRKRISRVLEIYVLQLKAIKELNNWKIKYITQKDMYNLLSNSWFLVNSRYPEGIKLKKGEVGANVFSKTRYILKV